MYRWVWLLTAGGLALVAHDGEVVDELWCRSAAEAAGNARAALDGYDGTNGRDDVDLRIVMVARLEDDIAAIGLRASDFELMTLSPAPPPPPDRIGTPLSELSGRPGHPGYDRFCQIAESWGYD